MDEYRAKIDRAKHACALAYAVLPVVVAMSRTGGACGNLGYIDTRSDLGLTRVDLFQRRRKILYPVWGIITGRS
jgi:hypothetical protein